MNLSGRHVVVTGASSGIGLATAEACKQAGAKLSIGARRVDRLPDLGEGSLRHELDVCDTGSIEAFLTAARDKNGPIDVLVNNAGLARGTETVASADGIAWREMIETNVVGLLEVTRRVVPEMIERESGDVVMIGSIAGHETYEGGSVYCATKRGVRSIAEGLRRETYRHGLRVMSVDPGMVDTEFSEVRFRGDRSKADKVYTGMRPLRAQDIADCILFAITRPSHVCLDDILVMPTDQASPTRVHRRD
ncbi:MAG: SDR family NAD(P)-dependent oxidoreductase [Planctomycetota bacterium]